MNWINGIVSVGIAALCFSIATAVILSVDDDHFSKRTNIIARIILAILVGTMFFLIGALN